MLDDPGRGPRNCSGVCRQACGSAEGSRLQVTLQLRLATQPSFRKRHVIICKDHSHMACAASMPFILGTGEQVHSQELWQPL